MNHKWFVMIRNKEQIPVPIVEFSDLDSWNGKPHIALFETHADAVLAASQSEEALGRGYEIYKWSL